MKKQRTAFINAVQIFLLTLIISVSTFVSVYYARSQKPIEITASAATTVESYYEDLDETKTGTAFRTELANLITETHTYNPSYDALRNIFKTADADPNKSGNILWFYSGTSVSFSGFGGSLGTTNREHVWPKNAGKAFPEKSDAGSDAHHLRPTEQQMNSTRNNNSFGEVPQTTSNIVKQAGSSSYENLCYLSGDFFYPGKGYRGATARILMYVQVRWGNQYSLTFVDSAGNNKTIGKISDLMKWHLQEPPTEAEKRRNEVVYGVQGNRNPFIDHPEYAEMIYCYDGKSYNNALLSIVDKYDTYTPGSATPGGTVNPPVVNPPVDPDPPVVNPDPTLEGVDGFRTAINALDGKSGESLYKHIVAAINIYNELSSEQKDLVVVEYSKLKSAVEKYNTAADVVNEEMDGALKDILMSVAVGGVSVLFLFKAIVKRFA